jgi:hypothetical protein
MFEDELVITIASAKQLSCEKLACTTHQQQTISMKNHRSNKTLTNNKHKKLVTTFYLQMPKQFFFNQTKMQPKKNELCKITY